MKKILIISPSEICHNPRLLKAADFFHEKGLEVIVWNCVIGVTTQSFLNEFKARKKYEIIDFDISKRNFGSRYNWIYVSAIQLISRIVFKVLKKNNPFFNFFKNKNIIGFKYNKPIDYILINIVDTLPIATKLASKTKAKLIYDSQEYFTGFYSNAESNIKEWVDISESNYIQKCYLILATTQIMASKIQEKYNLKSKVFRVRNLPYNYQETEIKHLEKSEKLKLVWHGFYIHFNSRGLNILLKAIVACEIPVILTLQGNITQIEKDKINSFLTENNSISKVEFKQAANPEKIVESLVKYDIGLIGELPLDENQLFTSSNKLFDYLHAGLVVVSSDMPGIKETVDESKAGIIYKAGDYFELKNILTSLYFNNDELYRYKANAISFSKENYFKKDLEIVFNQFSK